MDEKLTAKELDRLADWLTAQGLTPEKVLECIKYIADEAPRRRGKRKPLTLQQINERQGFSQTAGGFPDGEICNEEVGDDNRDSVLYSCSFRACYFRLADVQCRDYKDGGYHSGY